MAQAWKTHWNTLAVQTFFCLKFPARSIKIPCEIKKIPCEPQHSGYLTKNSVRKKNSLQTSAFRLPGYRASSEPGLATPPFAAMSATNRIFFIYFYWRLPFVLQEFIWRCLILLPRTRLENKDILIWGSSPPLITMQSYTNCLRNPSYTKSTMSELSNR